jgi:hypothetical protein
MIKTFWALTGFVVLGSVFAQPAFSQVDACDHAINNISTTLQENGIIDIELRTRNNMENPPPGRPTMLIVSMGFRNVSTGQQQRISNFLNSPQLLLSLTRNIINNCNQANAVTYVQNHLQIEKTIGLVDGQIKFFDCVRHTGRDSIRLRWGQQLCP